MRAEVIVVAILIGAAACGSSASAPDAPTFGPADACPTTSISPNGTRDLVRTELSIDLSTMTATAAITVGPSSATGASFEIGQLHIDGVTMDGAPIAFSACTGKLDVDVPPSSTTSTVSIAYHWAYDPGQGASPDGWTLTWPNHCGNLFPCHSAPADGETYALSLLDVPAGQTAVYPASIPIDAPAYQLAWAIGPYQELDLGTTAAGTHVHAWYFASEMQSMITGTAHLRQAFDWFEQTLGPYPFGPDYGSVEVRWMVGGFDGMEHHPYSHISSTGLRDENTQVHEAAHGWFGDGVRIACWEDFVLSEGTASYLAARALEVTAGQAAGDAQWSGYQDELAHVSATDPVWPDGCAQVDVGGLFTDAPYMRGAFFYRAVALKVGAANLDHALGVFFARYHGQAAHMQDMLDVIASDTGYDPTACAQAWLKDSTVPAPGPCP